MSDIVFDPDTAGIRELLKGSGMQGILKEYGQQKAAQAGPGYNYAVHVHQKRAVANIYPDSEEAAQDNYDNNTLLKAVR